MTDHLAAEEAGRLEAALERIARAARPCAPAGVPPASATPEVAARLDSLIAELRLLLGTSL